jgi:hypothetical protein
MRDGVVAVLLVAAMIISAGTGYIIGRNETQSSPASTTLCTVFAPTMGALVRVVVGGTPVADAIVGGRDVGSCNNAQQEVALARTQTNSSGWASLLDGEFGAYELSVNCSWDSYALSVPLQPTAVTYVVFDIASGNVTTHFCYSNSNCRVVS